MSENVWSFDAQYTWRPYAKYLAWKWRRQGYKTAYHPVTCCRAIVAAVDSKRSGE